MVYFRICCETTVYDLLKKKLSCRRKAARRFLQLSLRVHVSFFGDP